MIIDDRRVSTAGTELGRDKEGHRWAELDAAEAVCSACGRVMPTGEWRWVSHEQPDWPQMCCDCADSE